MSPYGAGPDDGRVPEPPHVVATTFGALALCTAGGLVLGWGLRPLTQRFADSSPVISWLQVAVIFFVTAVLAAVAWSTRRTIVGRQFLEPHRAVNRLVLAKACALVGALVGGGYAGYALAWVGLPAELAEQRVIRAGVAAVAGFLMCGAALALERACRVREDDDAA